MTNEDQMKMEIEAGRAFIRGTVQGIAPAFALLAVMLAEHRETYGLIPTVVLGVVSVVLHCVGVFCFRPTWLLGKP